MDLMNFQLMRKPRTKGTDSFQFASMSGADATQWRERDPRDAAGLQGKLDSIGLAPVTAVTGSRLATSPPLRQASAPFPLTPLQQALVAIDSTDRWLLSVSDAPTAQDFRTYRDKLLSDFPDLTGTANGLREARDAVCAEIVAGLLRDDPKDKLARWCRWLLIADILDTHALPDTRLVSTSADRNVVSDWLHRREILVDPGMIPARPGTAHRVELVRAATVADLFVVRNEWSCYRPAEVASIVNTLANAKFEAESTITREQETTTTTDQETTSSSEQTQEDKSQTELASEIMRSSTLQSQISGNVSVSGQYGVTQVTAGASAGLSSSLGESVRQASKISREIVNKAVSKVESRVRETRVQRVFTRTVDRTLHAIDNTGAPNANGVFRWVERVDRFQVFRFPNRLQLEFQIPEPAEYLRWRVENRVDDNSTALRPPPPFDVEISQITPASYGELALRFLASNIPPPPEPSISIGAVLKDATKAEPVKNSTEQWQAPLVESMNSLTIPVGYLAKSVTYSGIALPFLARWRVESSLGTSPAKDYRNLEGFHHISFTVAVAGVATTFDSTSPAADSGISGFSLQLDNVGSDYSSQVTFANAQLKIKSTTVAIEPGVKDRLDIGFTGAGAASAEVSFDVACIAGDEVMNQWRSRVFDALLDAWQGWSQSWRTARAAGAAFGGLGGWDATSPARNLEIVKNELKRQVIEWLLDERPFKGRDAMMPANGGWSRMDVDKARAFAREIQFFEQAFEWGNITYVPYPYYWAREGEWTDLARIEAVDPTFAQFLRAGSVRVVVPARPGSETAVKHWLTYCEIDLPGRLPIPDDPSYVSIAQEIHDLTAPMSGGEPGPCWESKMATTLLWLDTASQLPHNDTRRLGAPPNPPEDPLCTDAPASPTSSGTKKSWLERLLDWLFGRELRNA